MEGNADLHSAVLQTLQSGETDNFCSRIYLLMDQHREMNMPNKKDYTLLGLAVENLEKKCVEHMLKHPSADRLDLLYSTGDREYTVREILRHTQT